MFSRLSFVVFICAIAIAAALPTETLREKRDVVDSVKNAWGEVVRTFSDAGDAVVHVFKRNEKGALDKIADAVKPTEKSTIDKMIDMVKPTEKSTIDKIGDSIKGLVQ